MNKQLEKALVVWNQAKQQVAGFAAAVDAERTARKRVFDLAFTSPKEGINTMDLPNLWKLKATYPFNYKVTEPELLRNDYSTLTSAGIPLNQVIRWVPEVNLKEWRKLTEEQQAMLAKYVEIKPGSMQLELKEPK